MDAPIRYIVLSGFSNFLTWPLCYTEPAMETHRWDSIELEQMNPTFARKVVHGVHMTVARVFLKEGGHVPVHSHPNEQICVCLRGKLRFVFPDGEATISGGEVVAVPPAVPHEVYALEESEAFDLFSPPREDWKRGDDAYLRQKS